MSDDTIVLTDVTESTLALAALAEPLAVTRDPDAPPPKKGGRGRQDYATPPEFLTAVRARFGPLGWDLAAVPQTSATDRYFFGPGSGYGEDALVMPWAERCELLGFAWLNPPFAHLDPWAKKCAEEMQRGARILMLTPASIGTRWFAEHVQPYAHVIGLSPRITFVGETAPYPKDLMLSVYCAGLTGFSTWHWWPTKETTR